MKNHFTKVNKMRDSYDFSKAKKNPYVKKLKKAITIRVDDDALEYFKNLVAKTEVPYQTLITGLNLKFFSLVFERSTRYFCPPKKITSV